MEPSKREPYVFEVPVGYRTTVFEALRWIQVHRDRTLALRHSCLHASCGTCGVRVNGREVLACVTPLEGLVMATRSGSVDPGLLLWLLEREAMSEVEMAAALEHEAGLAGLAGTADMREVLARAQAGKPEAELALDVYVHRLRASIGAMAATLGGLDALVFTGGVGERSPPIRALACQGLDFLGIELDPGRNREATGDNRIGLADAPVAILVVEAREDLQIAAEVRRLLNAAGVKA